MKNLEGNIGEVYSGKMAGEVLSDALNEANNPAEHSDSANEFVDLKMIENEIVSNFDGKTTYGQLYKLYKSNSDFPVEEIDNAKKFKKFYLDNQDHKSANAA